MKPATHVWFVVAAFVACVAWTHPGAARPQAATGLEAVYQQIENEPNLTVAEKYEQKMKVFNAALEAGDTYTSAFEDLATYTEVARETGGLFLPGFGKKLEEFETRLKEATENRAFAAFGAVKTASDYTAQAVSLVSEADAILSDQNLTPASRRTLLAMRGLGQAMESFGGEVPGIGSALEAYGQLVNQLTGAVRETAKNVTALKGGSFSDTEQHELGLGPGYIRTPLYDQGLKLVQELVNERGAERTYLQTPDHQWVEVSYDDVTEIWCEYKYANDKAPSEAQIMDYLNSKDLRDRLSQRARFRAEDQHADALRQELGLTDVSRTKVLGAEDDLQTLLRRLGLVVSPESSAFKNLLKGQLQDPHANDDLLRRLALAAHPNAREYFAWRGIDPDALSPEELSLRLIEYRTSGHTAYTKYLASPEAEKRAAPAAPAPTPSAGSVLDKAITKVQQERTSPTAPAPTGPPQQPDNECVKAARRKLDNGRRDFENWRTNLRGKTAAPFVCGSDPWIPCIPDSYKAVWIAVDGSVPKNKWGYDSPGGCDFSGSTNTAYNDCAWGVYLKKLEALVNAEMAKCPK